ncbi:YesK family protein [Psychrobacillus sp. NPDC058041]|uniref:YesK family protein n=1 Tax=Psychrobacillus sp. NPDC058041 TaxID=3346310 RepID=UPI0036DA10C2
MQIFVYITLVTIIIVSISSSILRKKNYSKYWIPSVLLIGISFVIAVVSIFTMNGWESMGFFIMFICITIGSFIGTAISLLTKFKKI